MNIGFFVRHFNERGTEVASYDYAQYNELLLNNKSYIICFTQQQQKAIGFPLERYSYDKFKNRFTIIEINAIEEMTNVIKKYNLSFFYTLTYGGGNDIYQFNNKNIWGICKTIKHCVFDTTYSEADFYISISHTLNQKNRTSIPVIPHIVKLPISDENLRNELQIPKDAIVFGSYGAAGSFNINIAHQSIKIYLDLDPNVYFLFMNIDHFIDHSQVIFLPGNPDPIFKSSFINACDAMILARGIGESFGLACGEFSIHNKPVITYALSPQRNHIDVLGSKAMLYKGPTELKQIFLGFDRVWHQNQDWDCYSKEFSPDTVMKKFASVFLDEKALKCSAIEISTLDRAAVQAKRLRKKLRSLSRKLYL